MQLVETVSSVPLFGSFGVDGANLVTRTTSISLSSVTKLQGNRMQPDQIDVTGAADNSKEMIALMGRVASERDRAAFLQIFKHFAPRVKSFLVARGLNPPAADDVLQEAMLAVWEKAASYNSDKAAVSTWIFTIARYKYIDRMRREGRRKTETDEPDLRASESPISDEEVMQQQRDDAVQAAIANLPEDQQSVIFLSFIRGLAHSEIAQQLGLPLGTVKSRIRRAFGQLREELGEVM